MEIYLCMMNSELQLTDISYMNAIYYHYQFVYIMKSTVFVR